MSDYVGRIFSLFRGRLNPPAIATDADRYNVAEDGLPPAGAQELANEIRDEKQTAMTMFGLSAVLLANIIPRLHNHPSHQVILWVCLALLLSFSFNLSLLAYLLTACSKKSLGIAKWARSLNCWSIIAIGLCWLVWFIGQFFL
ncbi:unnamed protein product [Spirodela intermedia]|uniref:Uncharacterized protein n=2 Tax=Spirodela intermedia TaxID=51605 RepID=A0A7I8IJA6_SPIIN|nr:unnamed protein product [Spirodela intermedia]CAA6657967.1 unnamed protein product [Spirodela intermedia]CAA7394098.1 unnamed protein product [Spirodela intermedia]